MTDTSRNFTANNNDEKGTNFPRMKKGHGTRWSKIFLCEVLGPKKLMIIRGLKHGWYKKSKQIKKKEIKLESKNLNLQVMNAN